MADFYLTGDPEADALLASDPLALLIGMQLDQQIPMEWAFAGPARLRERLGSRLDAKGVAHMDIEELEDVFRERPALHRYPGAMARRVHELCTYVIEHHGGNAARVWTEAKDGASLLARVKALPGFGDEKAKIFVALLGKRFGVQPKGWEAASAPFSDGVARSVADIDSAESLARVREWKRERKAAGMGKADP